MDRKLATVRRVRELRPIEGADFIELALVDGWQCVVKKGEFAVGQTAIYCEVDSFLPVKPEYEFLRKSSFKRMGEQEGFRLRTIKLRKQLSQGLLLPLETLFQNYSPTGSGDVVSFEEGADVTEVLGIVKWDPPLNAQLAGVARGNFPSFIPKTDQERIQNAGYLFHHIGQLEFEVTVKLNGSSCTFFLNEGEFGVCSRNIHLEETEGNSFWQAARALDAETLLRHIDANVAIQGELVGPGIQGNPEKVDALTFFVYDVFDIDTQVYLTPDERCSFMRAAQEYADSLGKGVKWSHVPILGRMPLKAFKSVDDILEYAEGPSINTDKREGVVFKSLQGRITFKAISNSYLLKEKD